MNYKHEIYNIAVETFLKQEAKLSLG